jgi:ParB-like chromosome segregation protein Spo0J
LLIFKHIKGNRIPNLKHVRRLVDSIKKYGMKCNPILVNEQMEVIDGQHRLLAAKETNSFVYYIIING